MGVLDCFTRLYGPDLINTHKNSPNYYAHIFADAGVEPAHALVIDDSLATVQWARQAGARALLIGTDLRSLAELPILLSSKL